MSAATEQATEQQELARDISVRATSDLVRRPRTIAETGLDITFLADLISKHLAASGAASMSSLVQRIALPSKIVDEVVHFLRQEARLEVLGTQTESGALRYALTDRGRALAAIAAPSASASSCGSSSTNSDALSPPRSRPR